MKQVSANGLELMTVRTGHGEPLLFLGGTGGDLRRKPNVLDSVLKNEFEVLAFDQRGMGQSSKPPAPYSMADYAEDAVALMAAFGWDSAHIIGYSFGGMVAQELAIRYPQQVRRLGLVATTAGGAGGSSYPLHELSALPLAEAARKALSVMDLSFTPEWQLAYPQQAEQRINDWLRRYKEFRHEPGAEAGALAQLAARAAHDTFTRLPEIIAPTLVIAGRLDGQAPLAAQQAMAAQIPDCRVCIVAGGHGQISENDEIYRLLAAHFRADQPESA